MQTDIDYVYIDRVNEIYGAESQGFEPWVQLPVHRFSRPTHSTALATFRMMLQKYNKSSVLQSV
jgi:hypothetical protein